MPDPTSNTPSAPANPVAPAPKTQPRGYFNQAQVADIQLAEDIIAAAADPENAPPLATRDITAEYIAGLGTAIAAARAKMSATGQANSGHQPATLNAEDAEDAERGLIARLRNIQAAAKQKHQMLAEDDDDATNFPTDGYLIGARLNPNRPLLLQNAEALRAKATADALPGYKTPEALARIATDIQAYKDATASQSERDEAAEQDRIQRDALVKKINARRTATQHAADALFPYTEEENRPTRKRFKLPLDRPLNG